MKRYFIHLLISLDQLVNALFGGHPDETLSSRWGRTRKESDIADLACRILDVIDREHCEDAIEDPQNPKHGPRSRTGNDPS